MKKLKRFDANKVALSLAIVFAIASFILSLVLLTTNDKYSTFGQGFMSGFHNVNTMKEMPLISSIIISPIIDLVLFYIVVYVLAIIYNFVAKKYPIELDI